MYVCVLAPNAASLLTLSLTVGATNMTVVVTITVFSTAVDAADADEIVGVDVYNERCAELVECWGCRVVEWR